MQNFFGFIDYTKEDSFQDKYSKNNNSIIIQKNYEKYNLFFSYNENRQASIIEEKNFFLFFMGELSNKLYLSSQLNIQDEMLSNSELLKKAYQRWGIKLLKKIEGKFSLIIYDKKRETLTLSKDKIGIIPLNFYHSNKVIIFGSRMSDFNQVTNFSQTINPEGLALYLQFGYIIQPNTIFKNCYKVKSGGSNHFDLQTNKEYSSLHWRLESEYVDEKIYLEEHETIETAEKLLIKSLQKNHIDQNKIAVSLSGGYDSSTIAALLKKESSHEVETFTIGFEENNINEAPFAKAIATHLGTKHHEHYFTKKDALKSILKLSKVYDEPFADYAASPTILTTELIKESGIKNLFIGDGGDEVFATADDVDFFNQIKSVPYDIRSLFLNPLKKIDMARVPYLKDKYNFPTKYEKLLQILSAKNIPQMTEARNVLFREKELKKTIKNYKNASETTFNEIDFKGSHETVDEIIGTYFKTSMIDGELVKSYSASNYQNIYIHTPFLDAELISYMAKVPSSVKIKDGIKKYLLKEISYQYIPKELLDRPKCGFDIPFALWMKGELKELIYTQINEERLNEDNLFYTSAIIELRDKFYEGNDNYKYKLWRIFLFQLWYENLKG